MTFISKADRPRRAMWSEPLYWLDASIAFFSLEKYLILRLIAVQSVRNPVAAYTLTVRIFVVVLAHAVFYQAIVRVIPGGMNYIDFNAAAFGLWMIFGSMEHKAIPSLIQISPNIPLRIRWINLFVADLVWITIKILLGLSALYFAFFLFPAPTLTGFGPHINFPLLSGLVILTGLLGSGFGLVFHAVNILVPALEGVMEVVMWFMFVSSGIYDTYTTLPEVVRPIFVLNPAMTVIEWGRRALDPGYPTGDLNLAYPICAAFVLLSLGFLFNRYQSRVDVP